MISAREAFERLQEGNRRFVTGERREDKFADESGRRGELLAEQEPFAIVLGCSDSRVPAEIIFDQGIGDLFVIRVAGNIVTPAQLGSVEFAADRFGTRLVIVLGHSQCGAVLTTLSEIEFPTEIRSPHLQSIVDCIRPSVAPLLDVEPRHDPDTLVREAVRANIRASARRLREGSPILEQLVRTQGLLVIGAEYSLETREVQVFDGWSEND